MSVSLEPGLTVAKRRPRFSLVHWAKLLLAVLVVAVTGFGLWLYLIFSSDRGLSHLRSNSQCRSISIRKEWRTLNEIQQQDYIRAVKCLHQQPSQIGLNQSHYHDFAYIHSHQGNNSHNTGYFLPWHRNFLHSYERALKERCDYAGSLIYWDWTLDWHQFGASSLFDPEQGFGGDGNRSDAKSVAYGYCVTDGPFARSQMLWYASSRRPHCLSRGFVTDQAKLNAIAARLHPSEIQAIVDGGGSFHDFWSRLENGPHNALPLIIRGDFYRLTAPNDPLFFLHHTQLDRLWWLWQQQQHRQNPQRRHTHALISDASSDEARSVTVQKPALASDSTVEDEAKSGRLLQYGALTEALHFHETLDVSQSPWCYVYDR